MFKFVSVIFMATTMFVSCLFTVSLVQADMLAYKSEGECIRGYIASGVERSDIVTDSGQCYLK